MYKITKSNIKDSILDSFNVFEIKFINFIFVEKIKIL